MRFVKISSCLFSRKGRDCLDLNFREANMHEHFNIVSLSKLTKSELETLLRHYKSLLRFSRCDTKVATKIEAVKTALKVKGGLTPA